MKLEIISGQSNVDLLDVVFDTLRQNNITTTQDECYMGVPESGTHPRDVYDLVRKKVSKHIETDKDLFILTFSDHVLNAVRVEIKKHGFEGALCRQYDNDGNCVTAKISKDGSMDYWMPGVFDTWEKALMELL